MSDLTPTALPKIVDFGMSKILTEDHDRSDGPLGTLGYIAPEILNKDTYGFKCDVWSIGCILY